MWCPEALCGAVLKELLGTLCFMYCAHAEHFADNQQYWISSAGYTRPHGHIIVHTVASSHIAYCRYYSFFLQISANPPLLVSGQNNINHQSTT